MNEVPRVAYLFGPLFGALGGAAFGWWMADSLERGGKIELFDKVAALRALADQLGERGMLMACCAAAFALVGLVATWRMRRASLRSDG